MLKGVFFFGFPTPKIGCEGGGGGGSNSPDSIPPGCRVHLRLMAIHLYIHPRWGIKGAFVHMGAGNSPNSAVHWRDDLSDVQADERRGTLAPRWTFRWPNSLTRKPEAAQAATLPQRGPCHFRSGHTSYCSVCLRKTPEPLYRGREAGKGALSVSPQPLATGVRCRQLVRIDISGLPAGLQPFWQPIAPWQRSAD